MPRQNSNPQIFENILRSPLFRKTREKFLSGDQLEIIKRPACFIIRLKNENSDSIKRIILIPPLGFTADKIDLLNPHPEVRRARIKILGKINPIKKGYKPIQTEAEFRFSLGRNVPTERTSAYAKFSKKYCSSQLKSWKNWFYVVKENGWGNFHNLINLSDEWIVVLLEKQLTDQKPINIATDLKKISPRQSENLKNALRKIEQSGDSIFDDKKLILQTLKFTENTLIPVFIKMLNIKETGKHEPCTFFALLLKIAKKNRALVLKEVKKAITHKLAPRYYLEDLENKLQK